MRDTLLTGLIRQLYSILTVGLVIKETKQINETMCIVTYVLLRAAIQMLSELGPAVAGSNLSHVISSRKLQEGNEF